MSTSPQPTGARDYVVLLRGINVGGKKIIKMKDLVDCFEQKGYAQVQTYVQSGNVVLSGSAHMPMAQIERELGEAIEASCGHEVPVMVRDAESWGAIMEESPFVTEAEHDPASVHVVVLGQEVVVDEVDLARLERARSGEERYLLTGCALHVYYAHGSGRSKLSHALFERVLGVACTARNWRTMQACAQMLEARKS